MMNILPQEKLDRLYKALEPLHRQYDPLARMLKVPLQSRGFLKAFQGFPVHPTRESVGYAAALLDTSDDRLHQRAIKILQQVLPLQDQQESSKTYGVWPKYLEEKPFKIVQPDPNWCDFLGTRMLQIIIYNRDKLPSELAARIDRAILHAARAIQRRNVPLDYTNIAIMGIYVTLVTAQIYKVSDLYSYALNRLREFHDYTFEQGGFSEYNSPTYTTITLKVLGRLRLHIKNVEVKPFIENLYHLAWEEISCHFHPSTLQWAGPHSRSYNTLLESEVTALIERSTSKHIAFGVTENHPTIDEHWLLLPCPQDLEPYFISASKAYTVSRTLSKKVPKQVLTTYLDPSFTIGTINYSDCWHQRRPLVAYWGNPLKTGYLRLRVLHNGIDCASAQFFSTQSEGNVLCGISFATDINPVNPYIEQKQDSNSKFAIQDLRLRFEVGGLTSLNHPQIDLPSLVGRESIVCLALGDLYIQIQVPYAQLDEMRGQWEMGQDSCCFYLDLVLWSGKARAFHLDKLTQFGIGFALQITNERVSPSSISVNLIDNHLVMAWQELSLTFQIQPAEQSSLNKAVRAGIKDPYEFKNI